MAATRGNKFRAEFFSQIRNVDIEEIRHRAVVLVEEVLIERGAGDQFTAMQISKLVLAPCDGTNLQKWNASPSVLSSVISDYREK